MRLSLTTLLVWFARKQKGASSFFEPKAEPMIPVWNWFFQEVVHEDKSYREAKRRLTVFRNSNMNNKLLCMKGYFHVVGHTFTTDKWEGAALKIWTKTPGTFWELHLKRRIFKTYSISCATLFFRNLFRKVKVTASYVLKDIFHNSPSRSSQHSLLADNIFKRQTWKLKSLAIVDINSHWLNR